MMWAADVTFTFNTDAGISALGISKPTASNGANLSTDKAYTLNEVSFTVTSGSTATRIWNSGGTLDLRIYKDGTLSFTAPGNITNITLTGSAVGVFNANVGTFASGTWTGNAESVTLTATGTGKINTITVTYVAENPGQEPVGPSSSAGKYVKVTSDSDLEDGQYLIVYEEGSVAFNGGLETLDAVGNSIDFEFNGNEISETSETKAAEFTYDAVNQTLKSASGYYIGQTSDANGLVSNKTTSYTNTISIVDGNANIVSSGGAYLRYNTTSGQTRFRYYKSSSYTGQKAIQLYKYVAGTPTNTANVTLSSYGYKTLVASEHFTVTGATAYIVTAATSAGVTTRSLNVVPKNTPVFLKGGASATATLNFDADATTDDVKDNKLAISEAGQSYNDHYVLASKSGSVSGSVGFYKWNGGTLGAGRVYLPKDYVTDAAARTFLPFDFDEATGISSMQNSQSTMPNEVYDLQGRRVAQPAKGLYIVNGKKVLVK